MSLRRKPLHYKSKIGYQLFVLLLLAAFNDSVQIVLSLEVMAGEKSSKETEGLLFYFFLVGKFCE